MLSLDVLRKLLSRISVTLATVMVMRFRREAFFAHRQTPVSVAITDKTDQEAKYAPRTRTRKYHWGGSCCRGVCFRVGL